MKFTFLEIEDPVLLDKVFEFRYKILCEELKFVDAENFPDKKESDQYDPYSIQFAALNENGEICASVRLIHHSPVGYPTENNMEFDINKDLFERDKLGEVSRIFIGPDYRDLKSTKIIFEDVKKYVYLKMKELGIEYSYGGLEKGFMRLLKIYKMAYQTIGQEQYHMGMRYPTILYTAKLEDDNPNLLELWNQLT